MYQQIYSNIVVKSDIPRNRPSSIILWSQSSIVERSCGLLFLLDIANACLFLASDQSRYITAASIEVTGNVEKHWLCRCISFFIVQPIVCPCFHSSSFFHRIRNVVRRNGFARLEKQIKTSVVTCRPSFATLFSYSGEINVISTWLYVKKINLNFCYCDSFF